VPIGHGEHARDDAVPVCLNSALQTQDPEPATDVLLAGQAEQDDALDTAYEFAGHCVHERDDPEPGWETPDCEKPSPQMHVDAVSPEE